MEFVQKLINLYKLTRFQAASSNTFSRNLADKFEMSLQILTQLK